MASFSLTSDNGGALTRGADYSFGISLTDSSSGSPVAVDLTGYTASVVLQRGEGADTLATFTTTTSSASITASLTHSVTSAIPLPIAQEDGTRWAWVKVLLTRPDGSILPGGEGPIQILA